MGDVNKSVDEELGRRQTSSGSGIQFPLDVTNPVSGEGRYVSFKFMKFNRRSSESKETEKEDYVIHLPMPSQLVNTDSISYEDFDGGSVAGGVDRMAGSTGILDGMWQSAKSVAEGSVRAAAAAVKGSATSSIVAQETGIVFNPRKSTIFQSASLKEYAFEFKLIAKNKDESDAIRNITDIFRFKSHPDIGKLGTYKIPEMVRIRFNPSEYLFEPNDCVLTGMSVSYNGDNTPTFFKGSNAPVEVSLSLQFKEIATDSKETLRKKGRGV